MRDPRVQEIAVAVDVHRLEHRNPVSPYDGRSLRGQVRTVWLNGDVVVRDAAVVRPGTGRALLPRPTAPAVPGTTGA